MFRFEVDLNDAVVVRVGDEQAVARDRQPRRLRELHRIKRLARLAGAEERFDDAHVVPVEADRLEFVVVAVGDVEDVVAEGDAERMRVDIGRSHAISNIELANLDELLPRGERR